MDSFLTELTTQGKMSGGLEHVGGFESGGTNPGFDVTDEGEFDIAGVTSTTTEHLNVARKMGRCPTC